MTKLGRFFQRFRAIRVYKNGNGFGFIWNWWHPLAWVGVPSIILVGIIFEGVPETWKYRHDLGLRLHPWFIEHPERLEWVY